MELVVLEESLHRVQSLLEELGVNHDRPWVVIHPGATALPRRYPPESFAVVAKQLVRDPNIQVIFTGTENDYPILLLLARALRSTITLRQPARLCRMLRTGNQQLY